MASPLKASEGAMSTSRSSNEEEGVRRSAWGIAGGMQPQKIHSPSPISRPSGVLGTSVSEASWARRESSRSES